MCPVQSDFMGKKKNRSSHGKGTKIVSIEEKRREAEDTAVKEELPEEAEPTVKEVQPTEEMPPSQTQSEITETASVSDQGKEEPTEEPVQDPTEDPDIHEEVSSSEQDETKDVAVWEVDITDGQARGSRRAEREELAGEELKVTVLEVEEEAPAEEQTDSDVPGEQEKAAESAGEETAGQKDTSPEEVLEGEDQRSWQEELAYLESEEYALSRKKERAVPVAAEETTAADMLPVEDSPIREIEKAEEAAPLQQKDTVKTAVEETEKTASGVKQEKQPETAEETAEDVPDTKQVRKKKAADPKKRKRQLRLMACTAAAVVILLVVGITAYLYNRFAPTTKRMDTTEYYQWMVARARGEESAVFGSGELAVVLQDEVSDKTALYTNERVYLNYDMVRGHIFTRFYWDSSLGKMLYTTADDTWQIPLNSSEYQTKEGTKTYEVPIFLTSGEEKYICADFLDDYANITCEVYPEEKHVLVTFKWGERSSAKALKNTAVRFGSDVKRLVLTSLRKGDDVFILGQTDDGTWKRVLTADGYIGWVSARKLSEEEKIQTSHEFEEETIPSKRLEEKVNLAWHQIDNADGNKYFTSATAGSSGLNVISPTWYALVDNAGNFSSYADKSYVTKAHKKNMQVWALVSNFSANMSTAELTASYEARSTLIANLMAEAEKLGLDGINIDFESITESGGYGYVQFIRELSVAARKNGLILSVDIPVPMAYNTHYDRAELGRYCDYVIMMGYDEHYAGSEAGSVASLSFEENGIRDSIAAQIPADKLISGIPFYTRLWYTSTAADGSTSTWSEAYGMNTVAKTLDTYDVTPTWDDETQQNYAEWTLEDGTLCRIWLEDETSIALKAKLVDTYALGGIAEWVLGFERDSIWPVIAEQLNQ